MKGMLFIFLASVFLCSCGNSYREKKEKQYEYTKMVSIYKALTKNPETAKVEYNDSIHKYMILLNGIE